MMAILLMTLAQFIAYTRGELAKGGFERVAADDAVYWRAGKGDVVVLLHGSNDQAGTWFAVAPKLAKTHRVIVPDLAGHGESGPHEGPLPLSLLVTRVHDVLAREDAKRVTLVGNSMGGWIAILYALKYPEQVERLVLEDASGMMWPLSVPLVATNREDAIKILRAVHGPNAPIADWTIDALLQPETTAAMKRVVAGGVLEYLLDEKLPSLKVPTTLIWGKDDGLLPVAYAEALQKMIAGSTLIIIDGAAHMPHRQQPERFLECLSKSSSPSGRE